MPLIRTPEERFTNLPDYPFAPSYQMIGDARLHYVDVGQGEETILCLHGEPSWSYLYRKMIPPLADVGRVVAPDLIGFGKSDKYTEPGEYSVAMHLASLVAFVEQLDLQTVTLIVQDWGGLLGLPLLSRLPERFSRLVILNTFLPTGEAVLSRAFLTWQRYAARSKELPIGRIIQSSTVRELPPEVIAAYEAPFPDIRYQAGAKIFPALVPTSPDDPAVPLMRDARTLLRRWQKPALVMFSDQDPILGGAAGFFRRLIPTATNQPEITITDAGHFLQEDKGEEIADHVVAYIRRT